MSAPLHEYARSARPLPPDRKVDATKSMLDELVDSNVPVYGFTTDVRDTKAQQLLERGCVINIQIPNEFANVARRKLGMSWMELTAPRRS